MKNKSSLYFFILLFIIVGVFYFFYIKIIVYENTVSNAIGYKGDIEELTNFHSVLNENLYGLFWGLLIIPGFICSYLIILLYKKIRNSELSGQKRLKGYGLFVNELNYICETIINSNNVDAIEITEKKGRIIIKPELEKTNYENFSDKSLLGINNLITDIVHTKFAEKINIIYENNTIKLLKR